jgi:Bacteriophage tail sheath protein
MPVLTTYPGVYVEEIPSGVHTITGVATSITAFVGRTLRGPTDLAVTVNSYGDFERTFGGLWLGSALGFAVRDFFLNGGAQAIIVRVYRADANPANAVFDAHTLLLRAAWPGTWGDQLRVRVDDDVRPLLPGEVANSLFNLSVKDTATGQTEIFRNVSVTPGHPRRIDTVLQNESNLVRIDDAQPTPIPNSAPPTYPAAQPGQDPFSDATPTLYATITDAGGAGGSDGLSLRRNEISDPSLEAAKQGMYALLDADLFNLLCIPPHKLSSDPDATAPVDVETALVDDATAFCRAHRAFMIVDPPYGSVLTDMAAFQASLTTTNYGALYFPTLLQPNPLHDGQLEQFAPCGSVAGIMSRTDSERGVWKAPAGLEARLTGVTALSVPLTDAENGQLNPLGINCLRAMPAAGRVVWGARTLEGSDRLASEWKYIPVRRTALFLEESLFRGTQWVVFEPNDEPLWAQIRLNLGAFMQSLFRQGAFQGKTPKEAYLVKCDSETTTQDDINRGVVNILVGFAPLKPAEFVIIKIQQLAGQIET